SAGLVLRLADLIGPTPPRADNPTLPSRAREQMFPGATIFVRISVSNFEPTLVISDLITVLRGVALSLFGRLRGTGRGRGSHEQNRRDSKNDIPAHINSYVSVAI